LPCIISFGVINSNSPLQNAGIFIGEINITGWDANGKNNQAQGSISGHGNFVAQNMNYNFDGMELMDGVIYDQDAKPSLNYQM